MTSRYLLDTNVLLCLLLNDERLGLSAQRLLDTKLSYCVVSVASLWEIVVKCRVGKLQLPGEVDDLLHNFGVPILPIESGHVDSYRSVPEIGHRDPFDLMLMAQAENEGLILLTMDKTISKLSAKVPGLAVMDARS